MNSVRSLCWHKKTAAATKASTELQRLPPTDLAFRLNVRRALYQLQIWLHADELNPPDLLPTDWGWHIEGGSLEATQLPPGTAIAPDGLLNSVKCQCKAVNKRCEGGHCTCKSSNISCSKFCGCGYDGVRCGNSELLSLDDEDKDDQREELTSGDESN